MKIVLIRHLAPSIEHGICYGRLDIPQDPSVTDQMEALAARPALCGAGHVWTSPARRCRVLAAAIASPSRVPTTIDPRLRELDFGDWEGKPWSGISRSDLDRWAASPLTFAPPNGETGAALVHRITGFLDALERDQRDCVIVSHGGPLKILAALLEARPVDLLAAAPGLGSLRIVVRDPLRSSQNDRDHPGGGTNG